MNFRQTTLIFLTLILSSGLLFAMDKAIGTTTQPAPINDKMPYRVIYNTADGGAIERLNRGYKLSYKKWSPEYAAAERVSPGSGVMQLITATQEEYAGGLHYKTSSTGPYFAFDKAGLTNQELFEKLKAEFEFARYISR